MSSDAVHKAIDPAISELKSIPGIILLFLIKPVLPLTRGSRERPFSLRSILVRERLFYPESIEEEQA
jgi:hypothetical protein